MWDDLLMRALEARREQQLAGVEIQPDAKDERPGLAQIRAEARSGECLFCPRQTEHVICGAKHCRSAYRRAWKRDVNRGQS